MRQIFVATVGAAILSLAFAPSALAADIPAKASVYKAPAVLTSDSWTGFYVGGSLGGRWNKSDWTTTSILIPAVPATTINNPATFSNSSVRAGIYAGYNWQVAPLWVVGIEGDLAWANNKSTTSPIPGVFGILVATADTAERKDKWDGSLRGRVGYLFTPTLLAFGTGGVSWMASETSVRCGNSAPNWCSGTNFTTSRVDTASKTVAGWTLGGGLEWMLNSNWLIRGEYRYTQYSGYQFSLLQNGSTGTGTIDALAGNTGRIRTQIAQIGIAYKFGGSRY
jgi:outer membrane immunogenic protein